MELRAKHNEIVTQKMWHVTIALSNAQNPVSSHFLRNLDRGLEALVSCALESGGYVSQGIQELLQFRRYMNVFS